MKTKMLMASAAILGAMTASERMAGRYLRDGTGHPDPKSAEQLAADVKKMFQESLDKVKEIADEALGKAKTGENLSTSLKEKADEALVKMNTLQEQVSEMEQRLARGTGDGKDGEKSIGEQFTEDQKVKEFLGQKMPRGRVDLTVKATITSATTNAAGSVGAALQATRLPGVVELPQRRMTVRDLLTPGRMDQNALEYVQEKVFNNNAGMVAEGAAKPQSDIQLELKSTTAKVIAHHFKASRQIMEDLAQLRSLIDNRGFYGLAFKEESQLLNGDGTGQNLLGIIPQATAFAAPITLTSPTSIDLMRLAMLQAALAEFPATGHVLNPIDWTWIETLKDAGGNYIIGDPQGSTAPRLWNLPVVTTQSMQVDKFLTGAFQLGAQLFDRWDARVELATENEDDFIKNLVTLLFEERLALAVYRPQAFIYGDFGRVA
ncbi:phage major capsid protein [Rhizobium laguerreae]|nr:phage major capsid protein [Rhizobium laguerreae]MBY3257071.1 phage major capsid protein [Rhizobium laguerreae]MBY3282432.1 phage major capsid protein [Rhizobium laguerreae]MBY3291959.1 phage major capsid protein [Rhizobium laguerreae]